jgi:chorismate--pyruvate lyase
MPSSLEPRWRPAHQFFRMPTIQQEWLLNEGSLTARLKQLSAGNFHIEVLRQQWHHARASEARLLGVSPRCACLIREVLLFGNNEAWIYARSVMPATSLTGQLHHLRRLKNSSLGELLFRDKSLTRSEFELTRISSDHPHLPQQLQRDNDLLARRCRFELSDKSLLVSEIFLPALWKKIQQHR